MGKCRLIFTLLFENGNYMLSRNFRLQRVGDLQWLRENYDFDAIAFSIDELVVLNVSRAEQSMSHFTESLGLLVDNYFMPIAAGGAIRSMDDAYGIIAAGADKLVLNTPIFNQQDLVKDLINNFGSQCIIGSIDYKKVNGVNKVFIDRGETMVDMSPLEAALHAQQLGVGEIFLTSMDKDGTGQGYDLDTIKEVVASTSIPVICSGGVGRSDQFYDGYQKGGAMALSTANLFNFMADGLTEGREHLLSQGVNMAKWNMDLFKTLKN